MLFLLLNATLPHFSYPSINQCHILDQQLKFLCFIWWQHCSNLGPSGGPQKGLEIIFSHSLHNFRLSFCSFSDCFLSSEAMETGYSKSGC